MALEVQITNGPSKLDLMLALFDVPNNELRITAIHVEFPDDDKFKWITATIHKVERVKKHLTNEPTLTEQWIISGICVNHFYGVHQNLTSIPFEAQFSTQSRTGTLKFMIPES